jgi:hypothetical protein
VTPVQKFACEVRIQQTLVEEHRDHPVAPNGSKNYSS